jgi:hypothetical protein
VARDAVLAERLSAQLLSGSGADNVLAVVERLLAVQAQDPRGARLAIRARSVGLSARDVDTALTEDRSVVISTLNRGTLHLVQSEDYWWLHALTTPPLAAGSTRRLAQEKVSPAEADRGVEVINRALARHGPLTREQLRQQIAEAGIRVEGQAFVHIVLLATIRGLIVRGPMLGAEHAFVLVRDWLGKPPKPMERDLALGELARRYLAGHGPASDRDLARWAGLTLGDARQGFRAIADQLADRTDALAALDHRPRRPDLPPPRLLGAFDPSLLGWASRAQIVGQEQGIVTSNGIFRPFAMVKGRAVATWTLNRRQVTLSPFTTIARAERTALDSDATEVLSFLG